MGVSEGDREVRDELERVQAENRELRGRLAELEAAGVEELEGIIAALEKDNVRLKQRLERADQVREAWDRKADRLKRELETARGEQERLRRLLQNARDEAWVKKKK